MRYFNLIMAGLIAILSTEPLTAKEIYYGKEAEKVSLSYGGATIFRFPQEVKTISQASRFEIRPADAEDPNYSVVSVTPRVTKAKDKITFILADGEIVHLELRVGSNKSSESFYDFKPEDHLLPMDQERGTSESSEMDLMKAMIRFEKLPGYEMKTLNQTIHTGESQIQSRLIRVYTGPQFSGYVFELKNRSRSKEAKVDFDQLSLGSPDQALLSQVDEPTLRPRQRSFLRIVAKPSSTYRNINLPWDEASKTKGEPK